MIRDITTTPGISTVYAVNAADHLISFTAATPGHLRSDLAITGLQAGETIGAIAFRPTNGGLYGFGTTGRLYAIDRNTAIASAVSAAPITPAYDGSKPSIDSVRFADLFRFQTLSGQNLVIDPDTGAVTSIDPAPTYAASDPAAGSTPAVASAAYVSQSYFNNTIWTRLFAIDSEQDTLIVRESSDASLYSSFGKLGRDVTADAGLDGYYATLTDAGASNSSIYLLPFSLSNGEGFNPVEITRIGTVGGGSIVRDMVIVPNSVIVLPSSASFASDRYAADLSSGSATIAVVRTGDMSGALMVSYRTTGGSALAGTDYTPVQGTLTFAAGQSTATFTVPLMPGAFIDDRRTVGLQLGQTPPQSAILTISAPAIVIPPPPVLTPGVATIGFGGTASAINALVVAYNGPADAALAADPSRFVAVAVTAGRRPRAIVLPVAATTYDPTSSATVLTLANPLGLRNVRSITVTAIGLAPGGASQALGYSVQSGRTTSYIDADGDRVVLAAMGRNARVVVVRRLDDRSVRAFVEGTPRFVTGFLIPRRGSNRRTVIDRFVTNGARLRLARSISTSVIVAS